MNKLSSCQTYNDLKKGFVDLDKMLGPDLPKYIIPQQFYETYFNIMAVKKYPLVQATIKAAKQGRIKLLNHSDPKDESIKHYVMPDCISCITTPPNPNKPTIALVNAIKKTGYIRNADKEAVGLKVNEVALYSYLQTGYVATLLAEKDQAVTNNVKLHTLLAEMYSSMFSRIIDQIYPITGEDGSYTRLSFLLCLFYYQFMCGLDDVTALKLSMRVKTVDPAEVSANSKVFASGNVKMSKFDDFISAFMREFPFIRQGSVTLRLIIGKTIKQYGAGAMFTLEHFQSFLNMIQCVGLRSGMYNDAMIAKIVPSNLIKDVDKILLLIGES